MWVTASLIPYVANWIFKGHTMTAQTRFNGSSLPTWLLAGLLMALVGLAQAQTPLDRIAAVVNNDIISLTELDEQTDLSLAE